MNIIQAGLDKSGNYWVWKILHQLLLDSGVTIKSNLDGVENLQELIGDLPLTVKDQIKTDVIDVVGEKYRWRVSSYYSENISDIRKYLDGSTHVWTHSKYSDGFNQIFDSVDKVIYLVRDPRAVIVSKARFSFTPYMRAAYPSCEKSVSAYIQNRYKWQIRTWCRHVSGWGEAMPDHAYVLFYENLVYDFSNELRLLSRYLETGIPEDVLEGYKEKFSKKNMSEVNPGHVSAISTNWREILTGDQLEEIQTVAEPLLKCFGYLDDDSREYNRKKFPSEVGPFLECMYLAKPTLKSSFEMLVSAYRAGSLKMRIGNLLRRYKLRFSK